MLNSKVDGSENTMWPNLGNLGKILHGFMKRGPFKHLGGNQKPWSGCNGKLKEDKAMGEKLGGFFGLVFIIMGLWKVSISVALCG